MRIILQPERGGTPLGHASPLAAADLGQAGAASGADGAAMVVPPVGTVARDGRTGSMPRLARASSPRPGHRRPPRQAGARPADRVGIGSTTVLDDSIMTGWQRKHPRI